jgi:hypothetical protein
LGHSRKHPYLLHGGNWKLTLLPPLDVLMHLLLSEIIFFHLPPCRRQKIPLWGKCGSFLERSIEKWKHRQNGDNFIANFGNSIQKKFSYIQQTRNYEISDWKVWKLHGEDFENLIVNI